MIKLEKTIERETSGAVFERSKNREVIVILKPPDLLGFRLKGTRRTYYLPSDCCYAMAVQAELEHSRRDKRRKR